MRPGQIVRLFYIGWVLQKHGVDELLFALPLFRQLRFLVYLSPAYWVGRRDRLRLTRGVRIRQALIDLGPLFVKFGQLLSTRRDLLPDDLARELAALQDRVPPFAGRQARAIAERAYGTTLDTIFAEFSEEALASASIAQVHAARLHDGSEVVVKIVRPDIESTIRRDIGLLRLVADNLQRYWPDARRLRPRELVDDYERTLIDELDLQREAANASLLRRNFEDSPLLYIPAVHWPYTRREVMVMERVHGTPISDVGALRAQRIDLKRLSEMGVEIFFSQVFRDSFFHADMHPGNIFVSPEGQYIAVDFGIMGTLSREDQRYLAENFLAFFERDYRRVAELHVESGWVPGGTRVEEFEAAIRTVCEPIFQRPLKDISFGHLLLRLFQTARRFNMEVQPQLVLLQKTLLNIEGLGRQLYPDLDLWQTAKPYLERWMEDQVGPAAFFRHLREELPRWAERLPHLPSLVHDVLEQQRRERVGQASQADELRKIRRDLRRYQRRAYAGAAGGALMLSAALLVGLGHPPPYVAQAPLLAWLLALSGALVLWIGWPRRD
ncbi:ubiquinone biosynthesis regulatory protein kinase UbiB [Ectothiorhodospiraceae bacterium 2226]|nr:ubiquinone biosynthesis regulatory protein kinase UbiB [Ectothiorhodospiraceae bacterium 2226]